MSEDSIRERVFDYISDERERQDAKWGGKDHDMDHYKRIWTRLIVRQLGDADRTLERGGIDDWGNQMVQVAALAVAALECLGIEYEEMFGNLDDMIDMDASDAGSSYVKFEETDRGFPLGKFKDLYGAECSVQESSLASKHAIWLGVDEAEYYKGDGKPRMHLTQDQVKELIPVLQRFVDTGYVVSSEGDSESGGTE